MPLDVDEWSLSIYPNLMFFTSKVAALGLNYKLKNWQHKNDGSMPYS